jgi:alkylated DNA repair dioxygenase AlkB
MMLFEPDFSDLPDCKLTYIPDFLDLNRANELFHSLLKQVPWQEDTITVFGKTYNQPRLTALYGETGKAYTYSGITMYPHPFTPELEALRQLVAEKSGATYSSVLLNLYRNGQDSNGWHADNEPELGNHPTIASVSLGAARYFHLKHRQHKELRVKVLLEPGSLLVMAGATQQHWLHQIPKTARPVEPRINLTFRKILEAR